MGSLTSNKGYVIGVRKAIGIFPLHASLLIHSLKGILQSSRIANTPTVTAVLAVEHPSGMNCGLYDILITIVAITKRSLHFGPSGLTFFRLCVCIGQSHVGHR